MGFLGSIGKVLGTVAKVGVNAVGKATVGVTPFKIGGAKPSTTTTVGATPPPSQPVAQPIPQPPQPSAATIAAQAVQAALDTVKFANAAETKPPATPPAVGVGGLSNQTWLFVGGGVVLLLVVLFAFSRK